MWTSRIVTIAAVLGATAPYAAAQTVRIVSIGDSYASGEGSPDASTERRCGLGMLSWVCQVNPSWNANGGDPWAASDNECDRSSKAGPLQGGRQFASAHGALSVELRSIACSGAQVPDLIDHGQDAHGNMSAQLRMVKDRFGVKRIDALVVSIGGNDVGFGGAVQFCMAAPHCFEAPPFTGDYRVNFHGDVEGSVEARQRELRSRYDRLRGFIASELPNVVNVFITEYPDPVRDDHGDYCNAAPIDDPLVGISEPEARWTSEVAIRMLDDTVRDAADRFAGDGWHYVGNVSAPFHNHGYCAHDRWLNTVNDSRHVEGSVIGAVHPNPRGQEVYRDAIAGALETLIPPTVPHLLTRGVANAKNQRLAVGPKFITLSWEHPGAAFYQLAFRAAPFRPREAGREGPMNAPGGVLGDPPRMLRSDGHWSYVTRITDTTFRHDVTAQTLDYAVRACTPAACSAWSNVVNVSNVTPGPVAVHVVGVHGWDVKLDWTTPETRPDMLDRYQVAWRYHESAGGWTTDFASTNAYSQAVPAMAGYDYAVRPCTVFLCGQWSPRLTTWTLAPAAPDHLVRSGGELTWVDTSEREQQFQIAVARRLEPIGRMPVSRLPWGGATAVLAPMNATRASVPADDYSWIRACNDAGCSPWTGRTVAGPAYEVPPAPSWPPPPRPANLVGPAELPPDSPIL